jgi:hypothetical protein
MGYPRKMLLHLFLALATGAATTYGQDPMTAFPKNYRVVFENAEFQVIHVRYGAHEKIGVHDHSKSPTVYVYLSDSGPVRFSHEGESDFVLQRPPLKKGAFRVSPGRIERHAVENLGDLDSDFLRVELKTIPAGGMLRSSRVGAASLPLKDTSAMEFQSSKLNVQRVICTHVCSLAGSPQGSLVIAFSPLQIGPEASRRSLKSGEAFWLNAGQAAPVTGDAGVPAHLLRIAVH